MGALPFSKLKQELETYYQRYHRLEYRRGDPVEVVWEYSKLEDQEVAGLWAALFAWGRRSVALSKVKKLLEVVSPSPFWALFEGYCLEVEWRHRTWSPQDIKMLWERLITLYRREGSLANFFWKRRSDWESAIAEFQSLIGAPPLHRHIGHLRQGSASKRILLWLRWMVRRDEIDPGPWEGFSSRVLFVPIDVHVNEWALARNLLSRRIPSWKSVIQLTDFFRQLCPEDPLRYDFALVTAGIHRCFAPCSAEKVCGFSSFCLE